MDCGNFDGSDLYSEIRINACHACGHIFNDLLDNEIMGLMRYYSDEYAPTNMVSTNKVGDLPGSTNALTRNRYSELFNFVSPFIEKDAAILDVGCAAGGFLNYLHDRQYHNLFGIEKTAAYADHAIANSPFSIKQGDAEAIPFESHSFDLVLLDQVLEHLVDPSKAFEEARRVLKKGGMFCIGVPDASRYDQHYFFDYYWFLLREHIQHFDLEHLKYLGLKNGFSIQHSIQVETPMMSEKMILPNLYVIFKKSPDAMMNEDNRDNTFGLKETLIHYLQLEEARSSEKRAIIEDLRRRKTPIFAWGIGREFLYLYASLGLKDCNLCGLVDLNPFKQSKCRINGLNISDQSVLNSAGPESIVLISALAHSKDIQKRLSERQFPGSVKILK
jgi:SAM-dependent methyltransferase